MSQCCEVVSECIERTLRAALVRAPARLSPIGKYLDFFLRLVIVAKLIVLACSGTASGSMKYWLSLSDVANNSSFASNWIGTVLPVSKSGGDIDGCLSYWLLLTITRTPRCRLPKESCLATDLA